MGKAILVVALFALVVYGTLRLLEIRRARRRPSAPPKRPDRRAIAPDDDIDFLRNLEQERRRKKREHPEDDPRDDPRDDADTN